MRRLGVLGGMGPAATVDFMGKLVALTPAERDQDHIPVIVANLPQVPDRTAAILGQGEDPLPRLLEGIGILNDAGVDLIAIPCSTSHHWFDALSAASRAPILHIARTAVAGIEAGERPLILATRGALASGVYQRELAARGLPFIVPDPAEEQSLVDRCIALVKGGKAGEAALALGDLLDSNAAKGATTLILGCTELPLAAQPLELDQFRVIDCTLALARRAVESALQPSWNSHPLPAEAGASHSKPAGRLIECAHATRTPPLIGQI